MVGYTSLEEFLEHYEYSIVTEILMYYQGQPIFITYDYDEQDRPIRAIRKSLEDSTIIFRGIHGDDAWLLDNYKVDGLSIRELVPLSDVTDMW
ncbi:MAG: hypothetical protein VB099_20930 [Candidatus Limiplasma sp.]|nr:hypothetical protein [Candidatus Limiplasma sp.]